jgi:hypothetical protein
MVTLIRNRASDEEILRRVGSDPRWVRSYEIKSAIVKHPHAPHAVALNLLKFLFWRDLAAVCESTVLFPPLRRLSERILAEKLGEMALGEKITFARIAGRGLIPRFMEESHLQVLEAVLWNPRATSSDVLATVHRPTSRAPVLEAIGRHPRWSSRSDIRLALMRNAQTPVSVSLSFLTSMRPDEIRGIADLPETPQLLKMACKRLLARTK